jgi:hypothetical protein
MGRAFPLEPGLEKIDRPDAYRTGDHSGARYEREALAESQILLARGGADPIRAPMLDKRFGPSLLTGSPEVAAFLYHEEGKELDQLAERLKKHIVIKATEGLDQERYEVSCT